MVLLFIVFVATYCITLRAIAIHRKKKAESHYIHFMRSRAHERYKEQIKRLYKHSSDAFSIISIRLNECPQMLEHHADEEEYISLLNECVQVAKLRSPI